MGPDLWDQMVRADNERASELFGPIIQMIDASAKISGSHLGTFRSYIGIMLLASLADRGSGHNGQTWTPEQLAEAVRQMAQTIWDQDRNPPHYREDK